MLHIKLPACSSYFDQRAKCKMTGSCKIFLHKMEIAMSVLLLWRPVHYGYICWIQLNKTLTKNSVANKPRKQNLAKLTRKNFKTHSLGTRGMQKKLATSIPIVQWCGHVWKLCCLCCFILTTTACTVLSPCTVRSFKPIQGPSFKFIHCLTDRRATAQWTLHSLRSYMCQYVVTISNPFYIWHRCLKRKILSALMKEQTWNNVSSFTISVCQNDRATNCTFLLVKVMSSFVCRVESTCCPDRHKCYTQLNTILMTSPDIA